MRFREERATDYRGLANAFNFRAGARRRKFAEPGRLAVCWAETLASSRFIDVTQDGKRILLGLPQENASTPLTLLLNWTQNLRR